jgi:hypothetical protein
LHDEGLGPTEAASAEVARPVNGDQCNAGQLGLPRALEVDECASGSGWLGTRCVRRKPVTDFGSKRVLSRREPKVHRVTVGDRAS